MPMNESKIKGVIWLTIRLHVHCTITAIDMPLYEVISGKYSQNIGPKDISKPRRNAQLSTISIVADCSRRTQVEKKVMKKRARNIQKEKMSMSVRLPK